MKRIEIRQCPECGKKVKYVGQGKWKKEIKAYEWYTTDHNCIKLNDSQLKELNKFIKNNL